MSTLVTGTSSKGSLKSRLRVSAVNFSTSVQSASEVSVKSEIQIQSSECDKSTEKKQIDEEAKIIPTTYKASKQSYKYSKDKLQQARMRTNDLETILETKVENNQDQQTKLEETSKEQLLNDEEVEQTMPQENNLKENVSQALNSDSESDASSEVVEQKKEAKEDEEQKFCVNESAVQEEEQFEKTTTRKVQVEIMIKMSREELAATIAKLAKQTQDMTLPEVHKNIIAREVFCMSQARHKVDQKSNPQLQAHTDSIFIRKTTVQQEEQKQFCRRLISEEEVFINIFI